jgi:hypothetical protein
VMKKLIGPVGVAIGVPPGGAAQPATKTAMAVDFNATGTTNRMELLLGLGCVIYAPDAPSLAWGLP